MRPILPVILSFVASLCAAPTVTLVGVTQTQAAISISGATGACTLALSHSATGTPLHPDVDATKYAGSNTDTGRADTFSRADGSKVVTVGHMNDDRALAADRVYYLTVSGCGTTANTTFKTATLPMGSNLTQPPPVNRSKWGGMGYQDIDWKTKDQEIIFPLTGVAMRPLNLGNDYSWKTGCNAISCPSAYYAFVDSYAASGWTNPTHVLNGSTSDASTSGTVALDLYADLFAAENGIVRPYIQGTTLDDIGIVLWSGDSDATAAHRQYDVCIFKNPNDGCYTAAVRVTAATTFGPTLSGSTDSDGAWPAGFPQNAMASWNSDAKHFLRQEDLSTQGGLNCTAGTCTIAAPNLFNQFSYSIKAGAKIRIAGSSAMGCPNNLCTVATYGGINSITLVETGVTVSGAAFNCYGWGVRIKKVDTTSTLTVGAAFKLAGSFPLNMQSGGDHCAPNSVTSGDGKVGYLCTATAGVVRNYINFVGNDGTIRGVSMAMVPPSSRFTGVPGSDLPSVFFHADAPFSFHPTDGSKIRFAAKTNTTPTSWSIYEMSYSGNYTTDFSQLSNYTGGTGGDLRITNYGGPDDLMTWTNLTPPSTGKDLMSQVAASPEYNAGLYGSDVTNWLFVGCTGDYCYFKNQYAGQGNLAPPSGGPAWIATIKLSTGLLQHPMCHTLTGQGCSNAIWGSLHSPQTFDYPPGALFLSLNLLATQSTGTTHGGPFKPQLKGILNPDGTTWNTNTALSWPPNPALYKSACPAGNILEAYGATGDQCITFKMTHPTSSYATTAEAAAYPCPTPSANCSMPLPLAPYMSMQDFVASPYDGEVFRVISVTPISGPDYQVIMQRDAGQDYCCQTGHTGRDHCNQNPTQAGHLNNWTPMMIPGKVNSCNSSPVLLDSATGNMQELGMLFNAHFNMGSGGSGLINFTTSTTAKYQIAFTHLADLPTTYTSLGEPAFAGMGAVIGAAGGLQSYTSLAHYANPAINWMVDTNMLVNDGNETPTDGFEPRRGWYHITGDIYRIDPIAYIFPAEGSFTLPRYKTYPMVGFSGRELWKNVSGPSCNVDAAPYTFGYVLHDGECHAGSLAGQVIVNLPYAYDANHGTLPGGTADQGQCAVSITWANSPCVIFAYNGPAGGIRQQRISSADSNGAHSRFISYGYSSPGRSVVFPHYVTHPSGTRVLAAPTNYVDGRAPVGFTISLPTWVETGTPVNDFINFPVTAASGDALAKLRFGYSRWSGPDNPANSFRCLDRAEPCTTATASGQPYTFESETGSTATSCASGCTLTAKTVQPNLMYYQTMRSSDGGATWHADPADPDIHVSALGAPQSGACFDLSFTPLSALAPSGGGTGTFSATVTDSSCDRSVTSSAGWLTCSANCTGTGSISGIGWSAAANAGVPRSATLTGGGLAFIVNQSGTVTCTYSLAPTSHTYPAAGAAQSVTVTASDPGCAWTAAYPDLWLTGPASGTGTQTVNIVAAANAGAVRTSTATIAGQSYATTQDAAVIVSGGPSTVISGGHLMTGGIAIR